MLTEWYVLRHADFLPDIMERKLSFFDFWAYVMKAHGGRFSALLGLVRVVLMIVLDTSCCERGSSRMKHIQSTRNGLQRSAMDEHLRVVLNGVASDSFDPAPVIARWNENGRYLDGKLG